MNRTTLIAGMFGAFALASAASASPIVATAEALPTVVAHQLDGRDIEFTASAAHERRMEIIRNTTRQQRYSGRGAYGRGYGARPGYGYGRGYAPRHGYRRGYERY
jgi:hypothetical protein